MPLTEKILLLICAFGTLQGILLALLIYCHPKGDKTANFFLALFIFFISMVMTLPYFLQVVGWQNSFYVQPLPLLTGPLLYLYIRSFKEKITIRKAWPHFLFFAMFFIPAYLNTAGLAARYPHTESVPEELLRSPLTITLNLLKFAHCIFYFFLARKTLRSYQRCVRQLFSETSVISMRWGSLLTNGYIAVIISAVVIFMLMVSYPQYFNALLLMTMAISTPYIYVVTYKGIVQQTVWQISTGVSNEVLENEMKEADKTCSQKRVTAKAAAARANAKIDMIAARIIALMEESKLYQETELTVQDLSDKLEAPSYLVSMAFNEVMKKNFYDVVNGYRVEEAKRLLLNPKNESFTVLSVGFEAGFNSKTTFNTVFKKFTGYTPTEFRNNQKMTAELA